MLRHTRNAAVSVLVSLQPTRKSVAAVLMFLLVLAGAGVARAQNCRDPWITGARKSLGKGSTADSTDNGLCNKNRYHAGKWSNKGETLGWSGTASAQQFDVTVNPNNFTIAAGSSQTVTVTTAVNATTPAVATQVVYNLDITDNMGQHVGITTDSPKTSLRSGSMMSTVTFLIRIPASVPGPRPAPAPYGSSAQVEARDACG